ncbi:hypothetical protein LLG88_13450 [bacterium]|nr:hypothetical protein [bacterium]
MPDQPGHDAAARLLADVTAQRMTGDFSLSWDEQIALIRSALDAARLEGARETLDIVAGLKPTRFLCGLSMAGYREAIADVKAVLKQRGEAGT